MRSWLTCIYTLTGFLLKIKNASALCVKNRVNLCTRIFSISSACLIFKLMRTELIEGSMRTRSFSLRAIISGLSKTSGEVWASISGTLCRSEVCDAKFESVRAEVREERTAWRYGRSDWDCVLLVGISGHLNEEFTNHDLKLSSPLMRNQWSWSVVVHQCRDWWSRTSQRDWTVEVTLACSVLVGVYCPSQQAGADKSSLHTKYFHGAQTTRSLIQVMAISNYQDLGLCICHVLSC